MLAFKQTWEKVRCSWKSAEKLLSLVSWLQAAVSVLKIFLYDIQKIFLEVV